MENEKETKEFGKPIEAIWNEAFDTGKAVKLCGRTRGGKFTKAWFRCVDGREYHITRSQLLEYKPDARIHPNFKVTRTRKAP